MQGTFSLYIALTRTAVVESVTVAAGSVVNAVFQLKQIRDEFTLEVPIGITA